MLGNASGEGGVLKEELLVPLSPFSPLFSSLLSFSLLSSPFLSRSHSLFFSFSSFFSFSFSFALSLLLFPSPFLFLEIFLFFEGTTCTVHSQDVRDGTADCNQLYLHWNKEQFFLRHEFVYCEVCNFFGSFLAELSVFLLPRCLTFRFIRMLNKVINEHTYCYLKSDDTLLKITIRGLLIETLEVLSILRMG